MKAGHRLRIFFQVPSACQSRRRRQPVLPGDAHLEQEEDAGQGIVAGNRGCPPLGQETRWGSSGAMTPRSSRGNKGLAIIVILRSKIPEKCLRSSCQSQPPECDADRRSGRIACLGMRRIAPNVNPRPMRSMSSGVRRVPVVADRQEAELSSTSLKSVAATSRERSTVRAGGRAGAGFLVREQRRIKRMARGEPGPVISFHV